MDIEDQIRALIPRKKRPDPSMYAPDEYREMLEKERQKREGYIQNMPAKDSNESPKIRTMPYKDTGSKGPYIKKL